MKKKKKILQQEVHSSAEVARYLGALSKNCHNHIKIIAEMMFELNKKIDRKLKEMHARYENSMEILRKMTADTAIMKRDMGILK